MRRRFRLRAVAVALAAAGVLALVPVAPRAATAATGASTGARVFAELADPLMTDPVQVRVAVAGADGGATAFRGTVTLAVGAAKVTGAVSADAGGTGTATLATAALPGGDATLTVTVRPGGTLVVPRFITIDAPYALAGFGCAAVTPAAATTRWVVTSLHGLPVRTPAGRGGIQLPYVPSVARLTLITGDDGMPVSTRGSVVVTDGRGRKVATVALRPGVRPLLFGVPLPASARSAMRPGVYTATLLLTDAAGRSATAVQRVTMLAAARPDCR